MWFKVSSGGGTASGGVVQTSNISGIAVSSGGSNFGLVAHDTAGAAWTLAGVWSSAQAAQSALNALLVAAETSQGGAVLDPSAFT